MFPELLTCATLLSPLTVPSHSACHDVPARPALAAPTAAPAIAAPPAPAEPLRPTGAAPAPTPALPARGPPAQPIASSPPNSAPPANPPEVRPPAPPTPGPTLISRDFAKPTVRHPADIVSAKPIGETRTNPRHIAVVSGEIDKTISNESDRLRQFHQEGTVAPDGTIHWSKAVQVGPTQDVRTRDVFAHVPREVTKTDRQTGAVTVGRITDRTSRDSHTVSSKPEGHGGQRAGARK